MQRTSHTAKIASRSAKTASHTAIRAVIRTTVLAAAGLFATLSHAQWPDKPIKLIVPYPPGGSVDLIARQYSDYLKIALHQNVYIENKPGAGTNIGVHAAIQSKGDGYTLLLATESLATNPSIGPIPNFNAIEDLAPVSKLAYIPSLIAASPQFGAHSPQSFVQAAQAAPGHVSVGSASLTLQIATVERGTNVELNHITYKGGAQATADAVGNQLNAVMASIPVLHPFVTSGKLKPIAVTGERRSPSLPDVPTFREAGFPEAVIGSWYAVFAPKGTPAEVIHQVNQATHAFVQHPQYQPKLQALGYELQATTPQALQELLVQSTAKYHRFAKDNTQYFAQAK